MKVNPFLTVGYISTEYFCDREKELSDLEKFIKSQNNVTLISPRRLGKTGLILRLFDELKKEGDYYTLFVDIFSTRNLEEFIKTLAEAILREFPEKTSIGKMFWNFIKGLRPIISLDNITGSPQVEITYQMESEKEHTLYSILQFLEQQEKPIIVAIDEFQQIREYPQKNIEALLRTNIQQLRNITFIFSGSKRSIMTDIFFNAKNPFYRSTSFLNLEKIELKKYADFIRNHFERNEYIIDNQHIDLILELTQGYTFYTQSLCKKVFNTGEKQISVELIENAMNELLNENSPYFLQLRELLTSAQWNYLIAVAKEKKVEQPTAQQFLMKHKIGTAANSRRLMKALTEKELILETLHLQGKYYQIYDVFFHHWLRENY